MINVEYTGKETGFRALGFVPVSKISEMCENEGLRKILFRKKWESNDVVVKMRYSRDSNPLSWTYGRPDTYINVAYWGSNNEVGKRLTKKINEATVQTFRDFGFSEDQLKD